MPMMINDNILPPKLILLDAVGTLFGVRESVGDIYSKIAQKWGVNVCPKTLNQAFYQSFSAATPMAFPGADMAEIPQLELAWWRDIAAESFKAVGVFQEFSDFPKFFDHLYQEFATAEPWVVYPDVIPTLTKWRNCGIELGVLSNFDSRLYPVLEVLDLGGFFSTVTISTEVGAAKPDPKIFAVALEKYDFQPGEVLHIGDSLTADYEGAKSAGIAGVLVERDTPSTPDKASYSTLAEIEFNCDR